VARAEARPVHRAGEVLVPEERPVCRPPDLSGVAKDPVEREQGAVFVAGRVSKLRDGPIKRIFENLRLDLQPPVLCPVWN
jgi:hypothetical protein